MRSAEAGNKTQINCKTSVRIGFVFILIVFLIEGLSSQNLFPFRHKDKFFFVNDSLKPVSNKTYAFVFPFKGSRAIVKKGKKFGVVDRNENIIIPCIHDTILYGMDNFLCKDNNVPIWKDIDGKPFVNYGACGTLMFSVQFYTYKKDNKIGLLVWGSDGNKVDSLPNVYSKVTEIHSGIGAAKLGNKWGIINSTGKTITDFTLDSIDVNGDNFDSYYCLHKYYIKNLIGFINGTGKAVTNPKYINSYLNIDKFTLVRTQDNKLGYIDYLGKEYFK